MDDFALPADDALMARVAWLYYNDGRTQSEIGDRLNLSRIKVSRMLDQGREAGLIQIRVNSLHHGCLEAEAALRRRFGLADCRVVPATDHGALNARLGDAAAQFMMQALRPGQMLAVGWGHTVGQAIGKLGHFARQHDIGLVTLTGGVQSYIDGVRSANWGSGVYIVPSPLVVGSPDLAAALAAERSIATLLDMARRADVKLVGIGGVTAASTVVAQGVVTSAEIEPLRRMGAVGDILCRFYDAGGAPVDLDLHSRVVGLDLATLKGSGQVVAVAGGAEKAAPILGALSGGLLDVLITDETTAGLLLQERGER